MSHNANTPLGRWDEEQGGEGILVDGQVFFPNGARRDSWGTYCQPPPKDRKVRLRRQKTYWAAMLARTEKDRQHLSLALRGRKDTPFRWPATLYGPGPKDGTAALKFLTARAEEERRKLAEVEAELNPPPEPAIVYEDDEEDN